MNHAFPGPGRGSSARRKHTTSLVPARTHANVQVNYCAYMHPNHLGFKAGGFQAFNMGYRGSAPIRRTA
ncbi:hypothetical protein B0H13DRAFT_2365460 [Mycena leptocephala]|nr:hypothetical protein B0H13DRAFT_2365460 [Mycena leptocephala]